MAQAARRRADLPRIVVIADEPLASLLGLILRHTRAEIVTVSSQTDGMARIRDLAAKLVMVEVRAGDGRVVQEIRRRAAGKVAVIGLMRERELTAKLDLFRHGADEVLEVPFTADEVVGRTLACMARVLGKPVEVQAAIRVGDLVIDVLERRVRAGSVEVRLSPLQQSMLYLLASRGGEVITRNEILDAIWGPEHEAQSNVIDRHIRDLRTRLQDDWRRPRFIETMPGRGYRFVATVVPPSRAAG